MSDITVVVTSCRRHDLLQRTLASFFETQGDAAAEILVIEDSDDAGVHAVADRFPGRPIRILLNGSNIGQVRSVDRAYAAVRTGLIFHLEDDWEFTRPGTLADAARLLLVHSGALLVMAREAADMPRYVRSLRDQSFGGIRYKRVFPELHHAWHSFTFNPTLKRTADYRRLAGGYAGLGDERAISRRCKAEGWDMLWLCEGGVRHIGDARSTDPLARGAIRDRSAAEAVRGLLTRENAVKWRESVKRRFWHRLRRLGVDTEPMQRRKGAGPAVPRDAME